MTYSEVLAIGENDGLFYRFAEGTGDNLFEEDELAGYVDYITLDIGNLVDSEGVINEDGHVDGAQIMLCKMYQDIFDSPEEVIQYCIDTGFVPDMNYEIVRTERWNYYGEDQGAASQA